MPRKPRLTARKRHSSFSKPNTSSTMGSEENRVLSTETQTDPVKVFPVNLEVCSVAIQTDAVEIPETAAKRNWTGIRKYANTITSFVICFGSIAIFLWDEGSINCSFE